MQRIKSIDILRGLSMMWMMIGHLSGWWMKNEDIWFAHLIFTIIDPIGASAFIFIAGVSTAISYRNRLVKAEINPDYSKEQIKNEYLLRATFIFIIAIMYNTFIAIGNWDIRWVWSWFILLTVAISLFLAWPLLKTSKMLRIGVAAFVWILNQILLIYLLPFQGQQNLNGILFHILYFPLDLDFILGFFPFLLIGTVVGDTIYEIYQKEDIIEKKKLYKSKFLYPCVIIGPSLIIFSIFFQLRLGDIYGHGTYLFDFPDFLISRSFSWFVYTMGILLILTSVFISIELFEIIKTEKSYKFLFYFSYYSFTVFLAHYILYFLFLDQLNLYIIWYFILAAIIIMGLILRGVYKKWGPKASLKVQIGRMATGLAKRIEDKKRKQTTT